MPVTTDYPGCTQCCSQCGDCSGCVGIPRTLHYAIASSCACFNGLTGDMTCQIATGPIFNPPFWCATFNVICPGAPLNFANLLEMGCAPADNTLRLATNFCATFGAANCITGSSFNFNFSPHANSLVCGPPFHAVWNKTLLVACGTTCPAGTTMDITITS